MKRKTGQDRSDHVDMAALRRRRSAAAPRAANIGETSEAIFLTSGYAYDCAGDAAARFAGEQVRA